MLRPSICGTISNIQLLDPISFNHLQCYNFLKMRSYKKRGWSRGTLFPAWFWWFSLYKGETFEPCSKNLKLNIVWVLYQLSTRLMNKMGDHLWKFFTSIANIIQFTNIHKVYKVFWRYGWVRKWNPIIE
jgi:hypothetical protein